MCKLTDEVKKFSIFAIEEYRACKRLSGAAAFSLFKESGLLDYIEEFYDILHSNGTEYLICDIDDYLESRRRLP
jgi:hypothetical protein